MKTVVNLKRAGALFKGLESRSQGNSKNPKNNQLGNLGGKIGFYKLG
jgi:hypothetical protein